jgi:hypothetical protein
MGGEGGVRYLTMSAAAIRLPLLLLYVYLLSQNLLEMKKPSEIVHCVLVDEAQFLSPEQITQLRKLTVTWKCPVICYGLRTGTTPINVPNKNAY